MSEVLELSNQLSEYTEKRYRRFYVTSQSIKIIVVIGSVFAGVSHFAIEKEMPDIWHFTGILASIIVGLMGLILVGLESGSADELEVARKSLSAAHKVETKFIELAVQGTEQENLQLRMAQLYLAIANMCSAIQAAARGSRSNEIGIIETLFKVSDRALKIASGFAMERHWTLCVYKAERDVESDRMMLRCIAGIRSVPCDLRLARRWPEGVGVAGAAYATGVEQIDPDPWGEGGRRPAPDLIRPDDKSRYRSIAAVPIKATSNGRPWGVVVASSDEKGFYSNTPSQGAKTITLETPRSLAMMVSLAIEACGAPH